ncbi:MAG: T9SS type A sorting domain-containing protein, partial [Cytophagaceae bacterium]|nr:T9SS type A sorting domain-containing protein [Cytophagaceae bacterium]
PVALTGNVYDGVLYPNQEGSTTECLPNGNVLYYSNSCAIADGTNANFGPNPIGTTGNSSTQGCISIPNPANPNTSFYFITTDVDNSGGSDCSTPSRGLWYYGASNAPSLSAGTQLMAATQVGEAIAVSSDNAGGYWIVAHGQLNGTNGTTYYAWHVSSAGVISGAPVTSTGSLVADNGRQQATIKFNKCNNRIGYITRGGWEVYNWNSTTGILGTLIRSGSVPAGFGYGCEFSPNGTVFYFTDLTESLYHVDLASGNTNDLISTDGAGSYKSWGNMHIGPDDKIYISNSYGAADPAPKYLAVISNPNSTTVAGCGFVKTGAGSFQLATAGNYPSTQSGLITLGWHNPKLPIIVSSSPICVGLSYTYNQYYGASIPVLANSEEWDFGSGYVTGLGATPTHNFGADATYPVKLRVKDQNCQVFYEQTTNVVVSCTAPVTLLSFKGRKDNGGVLLTWQTAMELNNDYFDILRSYDGVNFVSIGTKQGAGNTKALLNYSFSDLTATGSQVYYRLIQHDFDGKTEGSSIVTVKLDKSFGAPIGITPNPFNESFVLTKFNDEKASVIVYDLLGRILEQKSSSETEVVIQLGTGLATGTYIVEYITTASSYTTRVEKQ